MKYILLVIAVLVLLSELNTYGQSITWQRMYDTGASDDIGRDICDDGKGNFFICGWGRGTSGFYLMKINAYGVMLWERLGHNQLNIAMAVAPSGDGGCVVTGSNDSTYAIKFDSLGNVVWWKNYSYGSFIAYDIDKTSDGGYIICGEKLSTYRDGMAFKLDSLGNLKWLMIYPSNFYIQLFDIIETNDNGYIMTGAFEFYYGDTTRGYIIKVDSLGNYHWDKKFVLLNATLTRSICFINNSYVISGWTGRFKGYPYFIRTDLSGNINYTKIFSDTVSSSKPILQIINPNKYVIAYSLSSRPSLLSDGKIIITDSTGNVLHQRMLPSGGYLYMESLINLLNGDILAVGINEFDSTNNSDIYAVRTDSLLNTQPIGIKQKSHEIPERSYITNIYPNPFNSETKISYSVNSNSVIKIRLFDINGRYIDELINENKLQGEYYINWKTPQLSSGIYFCVLYVNNKFTSIKKIIYLK